MLVQVNDWDYQVTELEDKTDTKVHTLFHHSFRLDSIAMWEITKIGEKYTFTHCVKYPTGSLAMYIEDMEISERKATELIDRWDRIEEWA